MGNSKTLTVYIIARKDDLGFLMLPAKGAKHRWVSEPLAAHRFSTAEDAIKYASKNFDADWVYIAEIKIKKTNAELLH
jgi:hypothetical protein